MDLGIERKNLDSIASASPEKDKKSYPGFTLNDDQVGLVKGDETCNVGDEYSATVKLRVTRLSDDTYGKSLGFDVITLDDFTPVSDIVDNPDTEVDEANPAPTTMDDAKEEDVLGYKRAKKTLPPNFAKGLQD